MYYMLFTKLLCWLCCSGDTSMDSSQVSECVDSKPRDPSPIPQFPHTDLDNSESCEDVNVCAPVCTDYPKVKGTAGHLINLCN